MPKIARSTSPIYLTKGRPDRLPVAMTTGSGAAMDLTGMTISAALIWQGKSVDLRASIENAIAGRFAIVVSPDSTTGMPLGEQSRLSVSIKDSQGGFLDMVWPVVGEVP